MYDMCYQVFAPTGSAFSSEQMKGERAHSFEAKQRVDSSENGVHPIVA